MKFKLGQIVATPGALNALEVTGETAQTYINRHNSGDWGDLDEEDRAANDAALILGEEQRILSAYKLSDGTKIWIITEWDRSVTTILLPEEY
jgi:hypothetical protein